MGRSFRGFRWAVFLVLVAPAAQAQVPAQDVPEVRTSGVGHRSVRPDLATISVHLVAEDTTARMAGATLARRTDQLRQALERVGIPRDSIMNGSRWYWWRGRMDIRTNQRCIQYEDPRRGCFTFVDSTYILHEVLEVRIRDLNLIGAVIDTVLALRVTDISDIRFYATDTRAAEEEALREATLNARRQAELIASAGGNRLGSVILLTTETPRDELAGIRVTGTAITGSLNPVASTQITAPSITVTRTVQGRWRLLSP